MTDTTLKFRQFGTSKELGEAMIESINGAARHSAATLAALGLHFKVPRVTRRTVARYALARIVRGEVCCAWALGRRDAQMFAFESEVLRLSRRRGK